MKSIYYLFLVIFFSSCYKTLTIDGFDKQEWSSFNTSCNAYRIEKVDLLLDNRELLLESTQNEIESLLGAPEEHELYKRNQKFFHYRLTPHDSCSDETTALKYLSVRFNAIGRASDVQQVVR